MDKLLAGTPRPLEDERTALFSLVDRFSKSIMEYKDGYAQLVKKANGDINTRIQEKNQALKKLSTNQAKERADSEKKHEDELNRINQDIDKAKSSTLRKLDDYEKNCHKCINDEHDKVSQESKKDREYINGCKDIVSYIDSTVVSIQNVLGKTYSGEYKLERIRKKIKLDTMDFSDSKTAFDYMSRENSKKAWELCEEVHKITASLPKKIIFNNKRTAAIKEVLEIQKNVENSLHQIEKEIRSEQASRNKIYEKKCSSLREECNRNKQAAIEKRDNRIKELRASVDKENSIFNNSYRELIAKQKKKYNELANSNDSKIATAKRDWNNQIQKFENEFIRKMEELYPADKMNAWINQFWYHPRNVEQYKMVCDKVNYNVLIGMAQVDISDWTSGATGNTVRIVLKKYITLFGRNYEQANQSFKNNLILLPYSISIEKGESILLSHDDASGERAKSIINAVAMRLLNSVSACMMRFILFDAGGYGSFSPLKSLDPAVVIDPSEPTVKSIVYGEGRRNSEMRTLVSELSDAMSGIEGQMGQYSSIRDFNVKNPLSKQIYKPLLMANYPGGLEEEDIKTLSKLVKDCSRWGCSLFMAEPDGISKSLKPEFITIKNGLNKQLINIRMDSSKKYLKVTNATTATEKKAQLMFYGLPSNEAIEREIAPDIRKRSVAASRILINLFEAKDIFVSKNNWFKKKADDGIVVPIGYLESGAPFNMQFDDSYVNTMIMGQTGAGKSNLLHAFIMGVLLRYDPMEVKVFLIDFKKGLDFNIYTKYYLPSFSAIGINSDPEFALAMLKTVEEEMLRRKKVIDESGAKKIADHNRRKPERKLCRLIFIVDELYVLTEKADDELRKEILKLINTITHQGRAFGIHMIVCGQDLEKIDYFDPIKEQCETRIALHCGDDQVKKLLNDNAVTKMHSIDQNDHGACVFSIDKGKTLHLERTVFVEDSGQEKVLGEISNHYLSQKRNESTKILHSNVIDNPNHPLQLFVSHGIIPDLKMSLVIGDPISMERNISLRPTENLWIAGGYGSEASYDAAQSVVFFSAYSLLLSKLKNNNISIICSNCSDQPSRSIDEDEKDLFGQLTSSCNHLFSYDKSEKIQNTAVRIIDEIEKRKSNPNRCKAGLWWFVNRPETVSSLLQNRSFIMNFKEILLSGAKYNIHAVVWNYDIKKAEKLLIDRNMFRDKICLEMNTEDLKYVSGAEISPIPKGYKASIVGNSTMRFRVYDNPDGLWMNQLFNRLSTITNGKKQ